MPDFTRLSVKEKAVGFDHPTQLPRDEEEHRRWQAANRAWWEYAPMRYDWHEDLSQPAGSVSYFQEIDDRFLAAVRSFMPWRKIPFDSVIPFEHLPSLDVIEIGVGQGTHAQLLAAHAKSFTGVDLTFAAARMTAKRLKLFGLRGQIVQMDAERMGFRSASFDYVWSWGVVHQSADTRCVLEEINRILRPGGRCTVMVYYRSWWNYYAMGLLRTVIQRRPGSLHHASQSGTDGAIARYYKPAEWRTLASGLFAIDSVDIFGLKSDVVPLPRGRLKQAIIGALPDSFTRFLTRDLRMGSLLVARMRKADTP